jgi:hypothetical protein
MRGISSPHLPNACKSQTLLIYLSQSVWTGPQTTQAYQVSKGFLAFGYCKL